MQKRKNNAHSISQLPLDQDWPMDTIIPISTDPFGSYTGVCADITETPIQDADDL